MQEQTLWHIKWRSVQSTCKSLRAACRSDLFLTADEGSKSDKSATSILSLHKYNNTRTSTIQYSTCHFKLLLVPSARSNCSSPTMDPERLRYWDNLVNTPEGKEVSWYRTLAQAITEWREPTRSAEHFTLPLLPGMRMALRVDKTRAFDLLPDQDLIVNPMPTSHSTHILNLPQALVRGLAASLVVGCARDWPLSYCTVR